MLRQMTHLLSKTISSWDTFNNGDVGLFSPAGDPSWGAYLTRIDRHIAELRGLRNSLQYRIEIFENITNSVSCLILSGCK
jgi:hypothetical protein